MMHKSDTQNDSVLNSTIYYDELLVERVYFICSLLVSNSFRLFKVYVKTIKNTLNKAKLVLLVTASMNIKVILSIIENNRCLTDERCF